MKEPLIDLFLENYGEEGIVVPEDHHKWKYTKEWAAKTSLNVEDMRLVKSPISGESHYVIALTGGNNGSPDWVHYLNELSIFFVYANEHHKAWLIELKNDCPDDVFYVYIGLRDRTE